MSDSEITEPRRRFAVTIVGNAEGGAFSLCSGEWCTGPIAWNASAEEVADAVRALGIEPVEFSGGPLPEKQVELVLPPGADLTADETNSLGGDSSSLYVGGWSGTILVTEIE
ncbi:MAG: hypothetical protein M3R13_11315 [Armatimonadota bacterium]|nr:hypothetical protein [Armatimonadota bacterium]